MKDYFLDRELAVRPPVKRAAYSDRTAWILAELSRLVYEPLRRRSRLGASWRKCGKPSAAMRQTATCPQPDRRPTPTKGDRLKPELQPEATAVQVGVPRLRGPVTRRLRTPVVPGPAEAGTPTGGHRCKGWSSAFTRSHCPSPPHARRAGTG